VGDQSCCETADARSRAPAPAAAGGVRPARAGASPGRRDKKALAAATGCGRPVSGPRSCCCGRRPTFTAAASPGRRDGEALAGGCTAMEKEPIRGRKG
jgi:hypothetical protein